MNISQKIKNLILTPQPPDFGSTSLFVIQGNYPEIHNLSEGTTLLPLLKCNYFSCQKQRKPRLI